MEDLRWIRDKMGDFCFEHCEYMKFSETYHTCSLSKKNINCKLWEFLKFLAENKEKESGQIKD
mgnify:CR=1 FL=1